MTTLNNVKLTIDNVEHTFTQGTYNGMSVIVDNTVEHKGFVNATTFCGQFNKRFRKLFENHSFTEFIEEFENEYYSDTENNARPKKGEHKTPWMYQLNKGIPVSLNQYRGSYIDPRLIN